MKLENIDSKLIIYLYNIDSINFKDKKVLQDYFKKIFIKLKNNYNIKISGYYDIVVYIDQIYGIVLELVKEEIDYYDYFSNQVDMHILTKDTMFLYEIEDYFPFISIFNKIKIYSYKDKLYLLPLYKNNINYIIENSKIIYQDTEEIIKYGKLLKMSE